MEGQVDDAVFRYLDVVVVYAPKRIVHQVFPFVDERHVLRNDVPAYQELERLGVNRGFGTVIERNVVLSGLEADGLADEVIVGIPFIAVPEEGCTSISVAGGIA